MKNTTDILENLDSHPMDLVFTTRLLANLVINNMLSVCLSVPFCVLPV